MPFPNTNSPNNAANDVSAFVSPVGGLGAYGDGGKIIINTPSPGAASWLIDVLRWRFANSMGEQPIAKGGMLGATASRRTYNAYTWQAEVLMDLRVQAELLLRKGYILGGNVAYPQVEIYFQLGNPSSPGNAVNPRYYWLPRGKLQSFGPAIEANDKKKVRQVFVGTANSHVFLVPDQGNPNDPATYAGAYASYLAANPNA